MSVWRGVCDLRPSCGIQEADRQTLEPSLGRQPTAGLIHAGVPVWCIHTHKHTSFFLSWTIKHNTFFFLCVSVNIITMRHFPQAEVLRFTWPQKDTSARLKNVWIPLHYIMNIKPRGIYLTLWASSFTLGTFTVKRQKPCHVPFSSGKLI